MNNNTVSAGTPEHEKSDSFLMTIKPALEFWQAAVKLGPFSDAECNEFWADHETGALKDKPPEEVLTQLIRVVVHDLPTEKRDVVNVWSSIIQAVKSRNNPDTSTVPPNTAV